MKNSHKDVEPESNQTREPLVGYARRNEIPFESLDKANGLTSPGDPSVHTSSKEPNETKSVIGTFHKDRVSSHSLITTIEPRFALTNSEAQVVLRKIHSRFLKNESGQTNISLLRKMNSLLMKNDSWLWHAARHKDIFYVYVTVLSKLLQKLCEPLFIFIIGKLKLYNLEIIISEITELILTLSLDETTGSMLYLHNIREGIEEYIKETRTLAESSLIDNILTKNPTLIDFTAPFADRYNHLAVARQPRFAALRVTGTGREDDSNFLRNVNNILKTLRNIHTAELDDLSLVKDSDVRTEFIDTLCNSSITCLELFDLDPLITKALLQKLLESVRNLSICQGDNDTIQTEPFRLLPAKNLTTLHLESCMIDLTQASFQNLRQLFIDGISVTQENSPVALVAAISKMPKLEYLGMHHCKIKTPEQVLQESTLRSVILDDCNLNVDDGEQILEAIKDGKLDHIDSLRLIGHKNLRGLEQRFVELCLELYISAETLFDTDHLTFTLFNSASECEQEDPNEDYQKDDNRMASLETVVTGIIQKQVEEFRVARYWSNYSRFFKIPPELGQTKMTVIDGTPEQVQAMRSLISATLPEKMETLMTLMSRMTSEQMQAIRPLVSNTSPEHIQTITNFISNMTSEQIQAVTSMANITPEQIQSVLTGMFKIAPEQLQSLLTGMINITPEQIQSVFTVFSKITPELAQSTITGIHTIPQEQMQALNIKE